MADFNRSNRGGGRDFGRRSFGGDRREDRQMFKATCSNCGRECEVPFKPTGAKPVYCSDCFRTMGGPDSRRTDDRGSRRPNFDNRGDNRGSSAQPQYREQFEALNAKLDKILKLLGQDDTPQKQPKAPESAMPQIPEEEKMVQDLQLQPEEPTIIAKKKRAPRKNTPLPTPE